jgi:hypothetical protein
MSFREQSHTERMLMSSTRWRQSVFEKACPERSRRKGTGEILDKCESRYKIQTPRPPPIDGDMTDRFDLIGVAVSLNGVFIIMYWPR